MMAKRYVPNEGDIAISEFVIAVVDAVDATGRALAGREVLDIVSAEYRKRIERSKRDG